MKRIIILAGLLFWTVGQFSCINSLNPLVTYKDVVKDGRLVGEWTSADRDFKIESFPESKFAQEIEKSISGNNVHTPLSGKEKTDSILYSKAYIVTYSQANVTYSFVAALMKIDGKYFMDLYPVGIYDNDGKEVEMNKYGVEFMAAFTLARLDISADGKNAEIRFVDGDFVRSQVEGANMRVKYESDKITGSFIITASTTELQQFMKKYGDDSRMLSNKYDFKLSKQ